MDQPLLQRSMSMTDLEDSYISAADRLQDIDLGGIGADERCRTPPSPLPFSRVATTASMSSPPRLQHLHAPADRASVPLKHGQRGAAMADHLKLTALFSHRYSRRDISHSLAPKVIISPHSLFRCVGDATEVSSQLSECRSALVPSGWIHCLLQSGSG